MGGGGSIHANPMMAGLAPIHLQQQQQGQHQVFIAGPNAEKNFDHFYALTALEVRDEFDDVSLPGTLLFCQHFISQFPFWLTETFSFILFSARNDEQQVRIAIS